MLARAVRLVKQRRLLQSFSAVGSQPEGAADTQAISKKFVKLASHKQADSGSNEQARESKQAAPKRQHQPEKYGQGEKAIGFMFHDSNKEQNQKTGKGASGKYADKPSPPEGSEGGRKSMQFNFSNAESSL